MATVDWLDALDWGPEQLQDLRKAGYSFLRQGHYDMAIIYFEGLVTLDPNNVFDNQTLGALYLQVDRLDEALAQLDAALALDPTHPVTRLNKCKALIMLGRRDDGLALAHQLVREENEKVRGMAEALLMGYE